MEGELDLLLSVAGGLGRWQYVDDLKRVYVKDDDCLACLKDLARFLRRDDPEQREAFFKLGQLQTVENDVCPLLVEHPTDGELVYHALKVLTFMTMPVDPISYETPTQYSILASIKRCCMSRDVLAALMGLAAGPLSRHPRMSEEDHNVLQLLLTFIRNLVSIPDPPVTAGAAAAGASSMQEQLLLALHEESALELVLLVASHADERPFRADAPLLLDILAEVYAGVEVSDVLGASEEAARQQQEQEQQRRQQQEQQQRRHSAAAASKSKTLAQQLLKGKHLTRHGRFKSTLVSTHTDTAAHTYVHNLGQLHSLQAPETQLETNVRVPRMKRASPALLLALQSYSDSLLKGAYNVLMGHLRLGLAGGTSAGTLEAADIAKWFNLAAWFTAYVRLQQEEQYEAKKQQQQQAAGANADGTTADPAAAAAAAGEEASSQQQQQQQQREVSPFGCISATMGWETFHLTQMNFLGQVDIPARSDTKDWPLLHACTRLLREALGLLELAAKTGSDHDKTAAERLARRLLHDSTKQGLLASFAQRIKNFSARHEPRSAAGVLAEAVHSTLRLYDRLLARDNGNFLVKKKRRREGGGRRKKAPAAAEDKEEEEGKEDQQQDEADEQQQEDEQQGEQQGKEKEAQHHLPDEAAAAVPAAAADAAAEDGNPAAAAAAAAEGEVPGGPSSPKPAAAAAATTDAAAGGNGVDGAAAVTPAEATAGGAAAHTAAATSPSEASPAAGLADEIDPQQQQQQQQQQHNVADDSDSEGQGSLAAGNAAAAGTAAAAAAKARRPVLEELEEEEGSGSESDQEDTSTKEVALDLVKLLRQEFAVPAVVHFYTWLLAGYSKGNSDALNHAVVSFLWRLVLPEHVDLEPALYQLSVLRLFHQLLSDASLRGKPQHRSVLQLATRVVRGLFAKIAPPPVEATPAAEPAAAAEDAVQQQREREQEQRWRAGVAGMVCVELLFWTLPNICGSIRDDYYLHEGAGHAGGGRKGAQGADGLPKPRIMARLLNPAQEQKLVTFFEQLCADRANMQQLAWQMGGRLGPRQLASEMKRLGLKFGQLPQSLLRQLHQLWQENRDGGIAAAAAVIAQELPGGWTEKQVRRLLRTEGLTGNGGGRKRQQRRGSSDDEDDDGWDSTPEGGDVLLGVDKQHLERLYQQHLAEEDYVQKIAADLGPEHVNASTADVLATLRFHGIVEKPQKQRQACGGARGAAAGGGRRGGNADTRRVSKALLQSLCERHGTEADGLNLTAMALGLTVLEVQKLLVNHNISGEQHSSSDDDDDADSDASSDSEAAAAGGSRRRAAAAAAAAGTSSKAQRLPADVDTLKQLYQQQQQQQQEEDAAMEEDTAAAATAAAAAAGAGGVRDSILEGIAEQLPVPANAQQVLLWLQQAGIVPKEKQHKKKDKRRGRLAGSSRKAAAAAGDEDVEAGWEDEDAAAGDEKQNKRSYKKQRRARALEDILEEEEAGVAAAAAAAAAAVAAAVRRGGAVPEPQPLQLLGYLQALQQAHEHSQRWLDARGAVSWLLGKLDAAEAVWKAAAGLTGAAPADYCLVPGAGDDLDFFCSDWSNELLVAAGVRNDSGDYFKISGNSTPAWRSRVRAALQQAVEKLGSEEAAAACEVVMQEAAEAAAAERAAEEASAAAAQAKIAALTKEAGFGSGKGGRGKAAGGAGGGKGAKGRNAAGGGGKAKSKNAVAAAAAAESSDDGWDSDDAPKQPRKRHAAAAAEAADEDEGGSSSSSDGSGSDAESGRDSGMPQSDAYEDSDAEEEAAAVGGSPPVTGAGKVQQRKVQQRSRQQQAAAATRSKRCSVDEPQSEDDNEEGGARENSGAAAASRQHKKQRGSAATAAGGDGSSPGDASGARRAALQEITRRRQQQQAPPATSAAADVKPRMIQLDDDDDDLADELQDAVDEDAAPVATKSAAAGAAGARVGRHSGRAAMMLLDDDDD